MNAIEVIHLYDALPVQEQKIVAEHICKMATDQMTELKSQADFKEMVNQVFDEHSQLMERLAQ